MGFFIGSIIMKLIKTLFLLSPLCLLGCTTEEEDPTALQGTWQSAEFIDSQSNKTSDIIYEFSGNDFKELISIQNDDGTYQLDESSGSFEILEESIISEGGSEAYQINFTYDRDENAVKYDIAYIQDGELFFGSALQADCGDDTYAIVTTETTTSGGQVISTEKTTCYTRPTALNFGLAYSDID
ncbi:MAG: hypothetical protein ACI8SR_002345 [Oceanicoccus sp.]|jgi:hypothetical protein